jgi:hypothetical protein
MQQKRRIKMQSEMKDALNKEIRYLEYQIVGICAADRKAEYTILVANAHKMTVKKYLKARLDYAKNSLNLIKLLGEQLYIELTDSGWDIAEIQIENDGIDFNKIHLTDEIKKLIRFSENEYKSDHHAFLSDEARDTYQNNLKIMNQQKKDKESAEILAAIKERRSRNPLRPTIYH